MRFLNLLLIMLFCSNLYSYDEIENPDGSVTVKENGTVETEYPDGSTTDSDY